MSQNLMFTRKFAPLFWTQFLSAFNDNFLKNTLVFLILFQLGTSEGEGLANTQTLITLAGAIFIAPFLLLSALGGQMADRFDKARVAEKLKLAEIGGAFVAVLGMGLESITLLFVALFIFGVISALFGPIKYGILPDHLELRDLPKANAWVEGATFAAILGGTIIGGIAFQYDGSGWLFGPLMIGLAVCCWLCSKFIPATGSASPDLNINPNIFASTKSLVQELYTDSRLWRTALMVSWFWMIGALVLSVLPVIAKVILGGNEAVVTFYLAAFAIAIGVGSAIAAWLLSGRIVLLPAPVGTLLMALFCLDLFWVLSGEPAAKQASSLVEFLSFDNSWRVTLDLAGLAIAGSFLIVPSFTALQSWAPETNRARVIAANNALNAGFMVVAGLALAVIQSQGIGVATIMLGLAILNAIAAIWMLKKLPTNPFRDLIAIIFRAFHRLEVEGLENIKKAGKAPILALNHVSFLDGPLALALTEEEPTFAIDHTIAQAWWVKPFLKFCNAMPLNPAKPMATRSLIKVVKSGEPLVIFPEGRITVTGSLMKVYDGAAMVADKTGAMIVPIRIEGLERSYFSRLTSKQLRKQLFPKVKVTILEPQKLEIDENLKGRKRRAAAGSELYNIMSDLVLRTSLKDESTIFERVLKAADEQGYKKLATEDPVTGPLSYGKMLTGVSVLAHKFQDMFERQTHVGVMLPNANGSVVTILALLSAGKVPAMMNFTAGAANILSACKTAEVRTILTSRAFVDQAKLQNVVDEISKTVRIVWLDEMRESLTIMDKLKGLITREKMRHKPSIDDPAVILFTSGSEGTPKGVVLTHRNILANTAQAGARIDFSSSDKVFNILPVFHSFGLTAGTILPLISGVPVFLYPSPLHYRIIPELIYASNSTIIFGTDTFLTGYARVAHPYDFRSIRYCFAGAEPVRESTRNTYMSKFGLRILEGYGVTETSPVIAINTPMHAKAGTVGILLPGMEAKLEPVPGVDEGGRLFVKGPNVMAGYLLSDKPGVLQPLPDGWHDTGDIVTIDEEGFIAIKGRAKRFAKIGGEMVSLAAVESLAGELWPGELSAVSAVKDERKGEKLILITEHQNADRKEFLSFLKSKNAQDLMVPAEVRIVDKFPVLGSGKIDFVGVSEMVNNLT